LVPWDHRGAGTTLGRNAKAGNGEMTFDRRVAGAIEAFEFLRWHLRTDKVILLAESVGTLTGGPWSGAGPTERWDLAGNAKMAWAFRSHLPTPNLDRGLLFPRVALGLTAATRRIGWWVLSVLAELAEGLLLRCLESSELS
jgi:hypothetical protein